MIRGVRSAYRTLFLVAVGSGALMFALDIFGAFALKEVTLDGKVIPLEASQALGFVPGSSVLRQPLDLTANLMCRRAGIGAACVTVVSAHAVEIRTNQFKPAYYVYDSRSRLLRGLTAELVVAPLDTDREFESVPMFIGLGGLSLFDRPADFRLETIDAELQTLRDKSQELFSTISAIDCSQADYLIVRFRNSDVTLKTTALTFAESIEQLHALLAGASSVTQGATVIDMRYDGLMIIPPEGESSNGEAKKKRHG